MSTTYLPVSPGINLSRRLAGQRLTKKWVREMMRDHPEWDWRNLGSGGSYVNGEDAVNHDLTLQVMRDGTTVAMVTFQRVEKLPASEVSQDTRTPGEVWGYQAVVS